LPLQLAVGYVLLQGVGASLLLLLLLLLLVLLLLLLLLPAPLKTLLHTPTQQTPDQFEPHYGQPISQCELLLKNAKELGGSSSVQLVPTHYWFDSASNKYTSGGCYPDNWMNAQRVEYYCSRWECECDGVCAGVRRDLEGDCLSKHIRLI